MAVGCSFDGANRPGEDHDKISTNRSSGGLVAGRSYVCHGSKWSSHWRISTSAVEPQSLWLLWLLSPSLLPSSLLRLSPLLSPPLLPSLLLALSFSELRVSVVAKGCRASDKASPTAWRCSPQSFVPHLSSATSPLIAGLGHSNNKRRQAADRQHHARRSSSAVLRRTRRGEATGCHILLVLLPCCVALSDRDLSGL